ncbi:FMN-dependent oxidoreductase [Exophiala viscosa]|uniref:FMN-dependent oxidoreductase n=1 Tax=Exophiala viscosa TaxID=2486360 RepID=UPI00219F5036|nr:FMN-dependent oxidoreductase [Exophiala viscosa]
MAGHKKKLHLAAFINSGAASQAWRHPDISAHERLDVNYYIEYAQRAEKAKIDLLFLADGASFVVRDVAKHYSSVSSFEPATLFSAVAARTENIGLVYTASVSDNEPTHVARQLASLDHISHGRAGWNIVTTPGPGSVNLGVPKDEVNDSVAKYRRARAFCDVVKALWDSFEDDALLRDRESGIYVDLEKIHSPQIENEFYTANQPLHIERPPQGHPMLAQGGTSPDGMSFGGSTADLIYCANYSIEEGQKTYRTLKGHAVAAGRKPQHLLVFTGVAVVWGPTQEEAERKLRGISSLWPIEVAVDNLNIDFGDLDLDDPFPDINTLTGPIKSRGRAAAIAAFARSNNLTIRQMAERASVGLGHRPLVGTTQHIVDDMQAWLEAEATDGFAVIQPALINGLRDFTEHVVPELVRRGLFRREYEGRTLRDNLGIARPNNIYTDRRRTGSTE